MKFHAVNNAGLVHIRTSIEGLIAVRELTLRNNPIDYNIDTTSKSKL